MEGIFKTLTSAGSAEKGSSESLMNLDQLTDLAKNSKILDSNLSTGDVKNIFSKVTSESSNASKSSSGLDYTQFLSALKAMAVKKFPGCSDALEKLESLIMQNKEDVVKGAVEGAAKNVASSAFSKLSGSLF